MKQKLASLRKTAPQQADKREDKLADKPDPKAPNAPLHKQAGRKKGALQQSNASKNAVGSSGGPGGGGAAAGGGAGGGAQGGGAGAKNAASPPPATPPPAAPGADSTLTPEEIAILNNEGEHLDPRVLDLTSPTGSRDLEAVYDIGVQVSAVLGKSEIPVSGLLKLGRDSVVELDRRVGEAIDIYVNNRLVARGEVVVVEDRLGVTMTEIIKSDKSTF